MIEIIMIAVLAGALGAALMYIFVNKQPQPIAPTPLPVIIQIPRPPTQTFNTPYDLWRLEKVPEREAAQLIRRAQRQNYDMIQYMADQAGNIYILFQLRPESDLTYKSGVV